MVGHGIGILVTEMVYYFEAFKNFNLFLNSSEVVLFPRAGNGVYGFYFSLKL
jgi:hypothetical protein